MGASILFSREQSETYLGQVPQAWVAVEWHGDPHLIAAPFTWQPGRSTLELPRDLAAHLPRDGCNAAVCADEGRWFFDLRGVHLKGTLTFVKEEGDAAIYHFAEDRLRGWDFRLLADAVTDLTRPGSDAPLSRARGIDDGIIRIATLSKGGRPHITPIWYRRRDAQYVMQTGEPAMLVRNLRQHPTVAATIRYPDSDDFYPCTYLQGPARFSRNLLANLSASVAIRARYFLLHGGLRNTFQFARGLRYLPGFVTERSGPGCVILDAELTTEVSSAEGTARVWLELAAAATTA